MGPSLRSSPGRGSRPFSEADGPDIAGLNCIRLHHDADIIIGPTLMSTVFESGFEKNGTNRIGLALGEGEILLRNSGRAEHWSCGSAPAG